MPETLHLNKEFSLDTPCRFRLVFTSRRAQRIDFINKYDAWLMFSSQFKQIADKPNKQRKQMNLHQVTRYKRRLRQGTLTDANGSIEKQL